MLFETLCVKTKLKCSVPRAGREMPSIFCSTSGPTMVLELLPEVIDCHGQPNLMLGRCTLTPMRCSPAESAASTAHATARRKTKPTRPMMMAHFAQRGMRGRSRGQRRRGPGGQYGAGSGRGRVRVYPWGYDSE